MMQLNQILEQARNYYDGKCPGLAIKELKNAIKLIKTIRRRKK